MYKSFEIQNFRCFREFHIDQLRRINLIVGMNNVGKTALLEALFIHSILTNKKVMDSERFVYGSLKYILSKLWLLRGLTPHKMPSFRRKTEIMLESLFFDFDTDREMTFKSTEYDKEEHKLTIKVLKHAGIKDYAHIDWIYEHPQALEISFNISSYIYPYPPEINHKASISPNRTIDSVVFLASSYRPDPTLDSERLGNLEVQGEENVIVDALKIIEPRLKRLFVRVVDEVPIIHGDLGFRSRIPLPLMGEGMVKLCSIILAIANAKDGVVLIDEIENGFHYSIQSKVWTAIGKAAERFNVQVFATTHSREFIVAAHEAFSDDKYNFRLYRLERIGDEIEAIPYDKESLEAALEMDLEVR
ncbi:AAA family ATPase [Geoglobus acetivorans]|uniref:ATPase AAA-type core domain-containing protein n=1 Tax=Geoglobus acetivorans TaxID=565033 RepID=A0A0A7GBD1_GEOAI|nr:hypothetical protein GACE_0247 [Geoglobus acetivorans]